MSLKETYKRRGRGSDGGSHDNTLWLISFGDLLTLVLSTFLLLISLKAYTLGANKAVVIDETPKNEPVQLSSTLKIVSDKIWEPNNRELLFDVVSILKKNLSSERILVEIQPCMNQDEEWLPLHLYRLTRELKELNVDSHINPMFLDCDPGMAVGFRGKV